ncbi:MAG: ATP-dependent DNA helicase [Methanomicrobiales archaeon]|nr:ATP-dependent DNA helicase [Methanomicrobiales archaeon]MDI6875153.1 ATP-dependent DNA helicase [Methanomicrobiales archaeon]
MSALEDWFPYPSFRPYQRRMLEAVAETARRGGITLIDAPTGSGKSSVVSALLSESRGRPVFVAVRTVSQLNTFIRELELIRQKRKIRFAYLIGKSSMCPLGGEGDVYRRCEGVKTYSTSLMTERAKKGSLTPSKDILIKQQIRRSSRDHPLICPYFVHSRIFVNQEDAGLRMVPSPSLRARAEKVSSETVWPDRLAEVCGEICPYETMIHAARGSDVVLLNFHHLLNEGIREQLYSALNVEASRVLLLIDEAHNCGDAVQDIESVALEETLVDQASHELAHMRRNRGDVEAAEQILPPLRKFMEILKGSREAEDWFDPAIFTRMAIKETLYQDLEGVVDDLLDISEAIQEKNRKSGTFRESAVERLTEFLYKVYLSLQNPAFLTVYRKGESGITLEVRSIDPGSTLEAIGESHAACVLISGTLSPVESYRRYYFGNRTATTLSLPNAFPAQNRLILCASDITSAFSMRRNNDNLDRIQRYIETFAREDGNRAVYFPSYQILDTFVERCMPELQKRTVFVEPRDTAQASAALKTFLSLPDSGESGVLFAVCGGKWSEGLDYRGEMLSGAMVVGLPLAPYNRVRRTVIDYFRNKFGEEGEFICYTLPAINRALQALGRVLRTPEDRGVLVLGERRFLEPRVRSALPPWMQEELQVCSVETFPGVLRAWRS